MILSLTIPIQNLRGILKHRFCVLRPPINSILNVIPICLFFNSSRLQPGLLWMQMLISYKSIYRYTLISFRFDSAKIEHLFARELCNNAHIFIVIFAHYNHNSNHTQKKTE